MLITSRIRLCLLSAAAPLVLTAGIVQAQPASAANVAAQSAAAPEALHIPATPPTREGVTLTSRYDRFRDSSITIVEAHLGTAEHKRGGLAGLLDKVTAVDAGTIIVRMITAGDRAPFDAPDYVEVIYGEAEQMMERGDVSTSIERIGAEWLIDNHGPAVRTGAEKRMIGKPMEGTSKAKVRQGYRTVMPVSLFLRLANASDVAVRFGATEVTLDDAGRNALALAGSQLRSVRVRPREIATTVRESATTSTDNAPSKVNEATSATTATPAGSPAIAPVVPKPNQSTKAARAMLAQVHGVWADLSTLGNRSYFRFEDAGTAIYFVPGRILPPQSARYVVDPSKRLILVYESDRATAPVLTLSVVNASPDLLSLVQVDEGRPGRETQYRRVTISDGAEIEHRQIQRFVQYQSVSSY